MNYLIIDTQSDAVVGATRDDKYIGIGQRLIPAPEDVHLEHLSDYLVEGNSVRFDPVAGINRTKSARKTRIKQEAARLIDALNWRLERARERAEAGVTGVETVADVLGKREAIRTSSSKAEAAVEALTETATVQAFSWSVE